MDINFVRVCPVIYPLKAQLLFLRYYIKKHTLVPLYRLLMCMFSTKSTQTLNSFKQFLSQKWQTYGRGLLSLEVEQAMKHYISKDITAENREHTRTIDSSEIMQLSHTMKGRKPKPRQTYSIEELNQLKATLLSVADLIDKKIKGEKFERDQKERMKAALLKDEIVEWLVHNGKFESKESIKLMPISLVRQAIGAIKKITDKRSINNKIEYLKTYKQIDQIGIGKQYRFLG